MIWESSYWKEDLLRLAAGLRKRQHRRRWSERAQAKLEKEILYAFYAVRKLIEAKRLTDRVANLQCVARSYPYTYTGKRLTLFDWVRNFEVAYDFRKEKSERLPIRFICNQIIHSYVFIECFGKSGGLSGIFFSSESQRYKRLYHMSIREILKALSKVGSDHVWNARAIYDDKLGDFVLRQE
jgi:hypothetical protein